MGSTSMWDAEQQRSRAERAEGKLAARERQIKRAMSLVRAEFANGNIPELTTDALDAILSEDETEEAGG